MFEKTWMSHDEAVAMSKAGYVTRYTDANGWHTVGRRSAVLADLREELSEALRQGWRHTAENLRGDIAQLEAAIRP